MHQYLSAIGFKGIQKKSQFRELLKRVEEHPDSRIIFTLDEESNLTLLTVEVAEGIGLALCGETEEDGSFRMEYHFPYILSDVVSTEAECSINRQSEKECYNGICDDDRIGLTLIFFITNFSQYCKYYSLHGSFPKVAAVCLSGLSVEGKILLPMERTKAQVEAKRRIDMRRNRMLEAAREGDENAMEDLTIEDMNLFHHMHHLATRCDLYSLVESCIMPHGVECDQYSILGDIQSVQKTENRISGEVLWVMDVLTSDIAIRVAIQESDLLGEPKVGRRFKGNVWLQGTGIYRDSYENGLSV